MLLFERPKNYGEMLNKIGWFTFLAALALTFLVATCSDAIWSVLTSVKVPVQIATLRIPILFVVPGLIVAGLARIIRLHDKMSDLFKIRETFDLYRILVPLCGAVEIPVNSSMRETLRSKRKKAMERTFYHYASFEAPQISKALVLSAIDVWTWYWILLEIIALLALTCLILAFVGSYGTGLAIAGLLLFSMIVFRTHFDVCGNKVDYQIDEILADPHHAAELKARFLAVLES